MLFVCERCVQAEAGEKDVAGEVLPRGGGRQGGGGAVVWAPGVWCEVRGVHVVWPRALCVAEVGVEGAGEVGCISVDGFPKGVIWLAQERVELCNNARDDQLRIRVGCEAVVLGEVQQHGHGILNGLTASQDDKHALYVHRNDAHALYVVSQRPWSNKLKLVEKETLPTILEH